jgi:PIN domain nuclease of toxin-antitoxin system
VILLDTHILLWLKDEPRHIGSEASFRLESAMAAGEVWLSVISFWEIAMLARKRKIEITMPLARWRAELAARTILEVPVDGLTAVKAGELDWDHGDPADRIIVATAMRLGLSLLTADRKILGWSGPLKLVDARS